VIKQSRINRAGQDKDRAKEHRAELGRAGQGNTHVHVHTGHLPSFTRKALPLDIGLLADQPIGGTRVHKGKLRIHFSNSCLDSIKEELGVVRHIQLRTLLGNIKPAVHCSFHFVVAAPDDNRGVPVDAPHLELNLCVYLHDTVKLIQQMMVSR